MHNFGTCKKSTAAQWQNPIFPASKHVSFPGFCHCTGVLFSQVPKLCTDLDLDLLYILILGTYSKFTQKNNFLALGVCFPQLCSSAGRRFAASTSRLQCYWRIVSFPQPKFRWKALWPGFHWDSAFVPEIPNPILRRGWIFFERTRILHFIRHFIEFIVVKMKWFVSINVNVIMTRQTCGQRSSRAAGSKRWALENAFFQSELLYVLNVKIIDWCCFYCFVRNSLVALLQALCARIFAVRFVDIGFVSDIVKETEIQVCALFDYLRRENASA